ncbi:MAG: ABC transporter substrate-binding protein/permease, partial [Gemmataceae bacterium]|nr:ABC transporter substrate-binding protein/permease [Gemmataceae bacterium]
PTGGAPFIYKNNKDEYTGFEWELAQYLGRQLDRQPVLVDGDWANLPEQLTKPRDVEKGVDVILNGYELRKDYCERFAVTRAYYVSRLGLVTRKDHPDLVSWADLQKQRGRKLQVATLGGSAAHKYVTTKFGDSVDSVTNPDVANVFKLVNDGRIDATVQDGPAVTHFLKEYPDLKQAGEAVQPGALPTYFVIYYRKGDDDLGRRLDAALADGLRDGTLKTIYEKYGLWNEDQERLKDALEQPWPPDFGDEGAVSRARLFWQLVDAAQMTLFLAVASFPLAVLGGLLVAVGRVYGPWPVRVPLGVYVEVIRGTPLLLQLFFVYYVVPDLFLRSELGPLVWAAKSLTPLLAGIVTLALNYSASEAENYRAGLLSVPVGQMEAALALGMTRGTALRRVVVPQAVRTVLPPVTNDFIALFKDTSVCSIIFVVELTRRYNELFNFNRNLVVELAVVTGSLYLLMSYPLALLARWMERRLQTGGKGVAK